MALLLVVGGVWLCRGFELAWQQTTPGERSPAGVTPQGVPSELPTGLPANVQAFLVLALPFAQQAHQALGWQTSVIVAQWGLEHGWSVPDAQGYNWGNTTYAPGCERRGGFCYASTPAEGLQQYVYTARLPFYVGVTQAAQQGAVAMAGALGRSPWDAGHYTHDGHPGDDLLAILQGFHLDVVD
jgi:hypothetical protein